MQPVLRHCLELLHGDSFATKARNNLTAAALRGFEKQKQQEQSSWLQTRS